MKRALFALLALSGSAFSQEINAAKLLKPSPDSWPTYNGDYSGKRHSALKQINTSNVNQLGVAWTYRASNYGAASFGAVLKSTPLLVNGVLYVTMPEHVWAVDARSGREIWHYKSPPSPGFHIGHRGVAMWGDWLYFETPNCDIVSLNAKDGTERWRKPIGDPKLEYFCTMAPLVVGNHVILGVGGDSLDIPGYMRSLDPETGETQWQWNSEPKPGEPGSETWPNADSMTHGGGMTWITGTYDPDLNLIYWGTGNPNPVHAGGARLGDNLWTCSIVAINPDTGKLVWYYQVSPHDTHDWDAAQTPVLIDAVFKGKPRKLIAQAARNGYFFVLDRSSGEHLLTEPFIDLNWSLGLNAKGQPIPNPKKEPARDGVLVAPSSNGATNWFAPTYSPQTGLFYVTTSQNYSVFYYTAEGKPEGYAGRDDFLTFTGEIKALDLQTGKPKWVHDIGALGAGLLSTDGGLLFAGDNAAHLLAIDSKDGKTLWHASMGANQMNGTITYQLDGRQYILAAGGDTLFAFALPN